MFCTSCGKELSPYDRVCPNCGAPVSGDDYQDAAPVGEPASYEQPAYEQPAYDQQPAYGQPDYGQPAYPQQPAYNQQPAYSAVDNPYGFNGTYSYQTPQTSGAGRGMGIASLILGISSLVTSWWYFLLFIPGIVTGIVGIVMAVISGHKGYTGKMRRSGKVMSIVGLAISGTLFLALVIAAIVNM